MKSIRAKIALATAAATALSTVVLAGPATAAPSATQAGPTCEAQVLGVLPDGRFASRYVRNTQVVTQKRTGSALPYRPRSTAHLYSEQVSGGVRFHFAQTAPDGTPRHLRVTDKADRKTLGFGVSKMRNSGFDARLLTSGGGTHTFAVERNGTFHRYVTYRNDRGRFFFGNPKRIPLNVSGLKTLSFYTRMKIGGVRSDVFYATTKTGALKQIRVPVRRPRNARAITVKRRGFASYTGLSLGACDGTVAKAFIIGINAKDNIAHRVVLRRQGSPKASNLSAKRRMDTGYSWKLRATL